MDRHAFDYFVGIDVSKETLDLCLRCSLDEPARSAIRVENNRPGFKRLLQWLSKQVAQRERCLLCLEHTGLYMEALLDVLTLEGLAVAVVETRALSRVRPSHHRKDDRFDAALLAEYAMRHLDRLQPYQAPHPSVEQVRLLHQERRRLVTQRGSVKQLLKESPRRRTDTSVAQALWREQIALYDRQIKVIEEEIRRRIDEDEGLRSRYEQMRSIEGFGEQAAVLWISLFYGRAHLKAREVASWLGMAPHAEQSGRWKRKGYSTGYGDGEARKLLALCAQSAAQHKERWRAYRQKKSAEGKPYRVIMNNISNKLIHVACAVWNQNGRFDPNHLSRYDSIRALAS